jgi:hypothetical protein
MFESLALITTCWRYNAWARRALGRRRKLDAVSVMRFEGDRQIERWFYLADLEAFDAFFGP